MLKTKRVTVDGEEYELTQLGAVEGRRLWLRLLRVITGPIKELAASPALDERSFTLAVALVVEHLDDETAEALYAAFSKTARVRQGERWPTLEGAIFDIHFAGRYLSMTKWLAECVLFNFADFLGEASLGSVTDLVRGAVSKRTSPKVSTGLSGES
jgi:hypothetical protein